MGSQMECRLKEFLENRLRKRTQTWCRVCHSTDCCQDNPTSADFTENADGDDNHENKREFSLAKLELLRQKRQAMEQYASDLGEISAQCRLRILRRPYLPCQGCLPPWLIAVLDHGISLPLIPTFPVSSEHLTEMCEGLNICDTELPDENKTAVLHARRIRVCVSGADQKNLLTPSRTSSKTSLPCLKVCEDISDGEFVFHPIHGSEGCSSSTSISDQYQLDRENSTLSYKEKRGKRTAQKTFQPSQSSSTPFIRNHGLFLESLRRKDNIGEISVPTSMAQVIEGCIEWTTSLICPDATVAQSRDERVLIVGELRSNEKSRDAWLPFRLLFFPHERSGVASMGMRGTYIRKAGETSPYNLRWKYDVDIPTNVKIWSGNK